jgi:hypothetical protein
VENLVDRIKMSILCGSPFVQSHIEIALIDLCSYFICLTFFYLYKLYIFISFVLFMYAAH